MLAFGILFTARREIFNGWGRKTERVLKRDSFRQAQNKQSGRKYLLFREEKTRIYGLSIKKCLPGMKICR